MPSLKEQPKTLKPYLFHGLELSWKEGDSDAIGDCPFCGKEGKFAVSIEKGTARCWTCEINPEAKGGGVNHLSFVRKLWEMDANGEVRRNVERDYKDEYTKMLAEKGAGNFDLEDVYMPEWVARHYERHEGKRAKGREGFMSGRVVSVLRDFFKTVMAKLRQFFRSTPTKTIDQHVDEILSDIVKSLKSGKRS